ncbi:hypothetical protein EDD18DRAFT_1380498 [Armillaria luteobubalina]|uniref:Transmembrane protein n=1 Tax=Armillaria luteobubalina TaxID=153913 RepID=A0AA39P409_9AGAR|nr:hypothetical protein EDD18DRAFT_1380498 [Armillaria luteobubalina]
MGPTPAPLFLARMGAYTTAFAWGAISLSIGLNMVVKQNQLKSFLRRSVAPLGITLRLVMNSVVHPAIASEVFCVITALYSLAAVISLFVGSGATSRKFITLHAYVFTFLTVALFACQIPVSDAVRRKGVEIWGWKDGVAVPSETLLEAAASLGVNPLYRHIHFILWFGVIPWFAFLFTLISAIVSFSALRGLRENTLPLAKARNAPMSQVA